MVPGALESFLRGATRLPVLPAVTARLLGVIDAPDSSATEVAAVIESDAALAVRLLRLANSPFYGQRTRVSSPARAVVLLGFKTIRSLALALWTHALHAQADPSGASAEVAPLFSHGLSTALMAAMLAERQRPAAAEDAFMAGLLHDIGRVALNAQLRGSYAAEIVAVADRDGIPLQEREAAVLGFDHRDLGGALLESWGLPPFLAEVARGHHDVRIDPGENFLLATVALADALSTQLGANLARHTPRPDRSELKAPFGLIEDAELQAFLDAGIEREAQFNLALE